MAERELSKGKKIGIFISCALVAVGLGIFAWKMYEYRNRFFPGTVINQIVCDDLTVEQVEELIRKKVEDYDLKIALRGNKEEIILGEQIDYRYVSDHSVEELLNSQNLFLWFTGYFKEREYTVKENIAFDKEKLQQEIQAFDCMKKEAQEEPKNAKVRFEKDRFVILDEVQGSKIKEEVFQEEAAKAVAGKQKFLDAEKADIYEKPELTKESKKLKKERDQLNELVKVCITYELPNGEKVLDGNTLRKWLVKDKEGNYKKDEEKFEKKLNQFVSELAEEVDTVGKPRPFHTTSGLDVEVTGGSYGWKINQKKERETLKEDIKRQENVSRKPKYSSEEKYTKNHGLGTTYIEVNLTEQHLYYYQKGKVVLDSPFVSGTMIRSRFTPPGVYFLSYKQRNRVLRGEKKPDGTYTYESPVSYWMPFNGGIGLHDATWRYRFGKDYYRYGGSHGCINLPLEKAGQIYRMIDKDTPIVCVYNEKYKLHG